MEAQQVTDLASVLTQYGPYGFLAVLFYCVSHLYKQQAALGKEFRETVQQNASDLANLQRETLQAINANTEAVERVQAAIDRIERSGSD